MQEADIKLNKIYVGKNQTDLPRVVRGFFTQSDRRVMVEWWPHYPDPNMASVRTVAITALKTFAGWAQREALPSDLKRKSIVGEQINV